MAKMRGLLRPRSKIDEEELASAQSRAAARLADLAEPREAAPAEGPSEVDRSPDVVEDGAIASSAPGDPGPEPAGPRPPIIVEGDADVFGGDWETGRHIDVMARLRAEMRDDDWQQPPGGHVAVSSRPGAAPGDAPSAVDASPDVIEDDGTTWVVPDDPGPWPGDRPRPPIVVEGDTGVVDREDGQVVDVMVPLQDAGGDGPTMPLGEGAVPAVARPKAPVGRSKRSSSRDRPDGSSAGRPTIVRATSTTAGSAPLPPAFCPYCALLLEPAPVSSHRCVRCRQRIIVKHTEGRAVYLTEAAVPVFVAERRRIAASGRLTRERERWLRLAAAAGAPVQSQARLAAARLTEGVVAAARTLYLTTVDRAFRAAKRDHDWEAASRIRREKATVLYRVAGSPLPPPADLVALFREGVVAELRGISEISRDAELVSASCCDVCRADDRLISRISLELRVPRLPHGGCPRGLCRCRGDLADRDRTTMRRYLRRRPRAESQGSPSEPEPTV
jgi:hypothetical protein